MEFTQIVIASLLIEAIWENCKMIWQNGKFSVNALGSLIIAIILCMTTRIDIFPMLGIAIQIPFLGCAFTGIIVSRGANFVNDLFTKLNK